MRRPKKKEMSRETAALAVKSTRSIDIRWRSWHLYIETVDAQELAFIREAYEVNLRLFNLGLESPKTTFARHLLKLNGAR